MVLRCTAKIFVGDCADGLAQFERVHLVSFFSDRYKNSIVAVVGPALASNAVRQIFGL